MRTVPFPSLRTPLTLDALPTPVLAWATGILRALPAFPKTEPQQYVALYAARRQELRRWPTQAELEQLRAISQAIWVIREMFADVGAVA